MDDGNLPVDIEVIAMLGVQNNRLSVLAAKLTPVTWNFCFLDVSHTLSKSNLCDNHPKLRMRQEGFVPFTPSPPLGVDVVIQMAG
jgi:hypothetical protein